MRSRAVLPLAAFAILLAGCSLVLPQSGPVAVERGVAEAEPMMFPECQTAELLFSGETTLAAIGLGELGGPDANKVGMIWVTAGPVAMPAPRGPGVVDPPDGRTVCVEWPDGSGISDTIPDEWVPPPGVPGAESSETTGGPPIGVLVLVGGAAVLIGASVLAFRREGA